MNNLKDKTRIYLTQRKGRVSVSGISIRFDWSIILGVAIVVVLGGALYSYFLYNGVSNGTIFDTTVPEGSEDFEKKRKEIEQVVSELN